MSKDRISFSSCKRCIWFPFPTVIISFWKEHIFLFGKYSFVDNFLGRTWNYRIMLQNFDISLHTFVDWQSFCCEACQYWLEQVKDKIGGPSILYLKQYVTKSPFIKFIQNHAVSTFFYGEHQTNQDLLKNVDIFEMSWLPCLFVTFFCNIHVYFTVERCVKHLHTDCGYF